MQFPTHFYSWLDFWLEYYHKPSVQKSTYTCTTYKITMIKKLVPDISLIEIDEFFCQDILNKMFDGGYARDTITKIRILLRKSLKLAQRKGLIVVNPTDDLIVPKAYTKVIEALSPDEQLKIEKACSKIAFGYLIIFLLYTGLRRSELENLTWNDFNQEQSEIYIRKSKTPAGARTVPLITVAKNIILSQQHCSKHNFIFHSPLGGPLSDTFLKRLYLEIRESTNIASFTNHVCRHSFATRLLERGASPKSVSVLLGHAKVEYAMNIYTTLQNKFIQKEIFLLEPIA